MEEKSTFKGTKDVANYYLTHPKNQKGITLIALVVTIVVLLILAGITITALFSENGIIKKAQDAKNETERDVGDTANGISNLIDQMNNQIGIDASAIANATNKSKYYGKTVNYTAGNQSSLGDITWQIFYADENNIYLIASDYVKYANLPQTSGSHNLTKGSTDYRAYWNDTTLADYYDSTTSKVTMNTLYQTLNKSHYDYLRGNYPNNDNMKAVAYMLDTKAWEGYKDSAGKADYVIGGPTVEMLMKSYSEKYANDKTIQGIKEGIYKYQAKASSTRGYQISQDYGEHWAGSYGEMLSTSDSLYINYTVTNAYGYRLASPSDGTWVMNVNYTGNVYAVAYDFPTMGFRPLVCLKSDTQLKLGIESDGVDFVIK